MANGNIVIVGLPSEVLPRLTGGLGIQHLEDGDIRRSHDRPDEVRNVSFEWMAKRMAGHLDGDRQPGALLIYQKPWKFLERQLRISACVPGTQAHIEWFAENALRFWRAYHESLLALRQQHETRCVLLNGDCPPGIEDLAALVGKKFGWQPATRNAPPEPAGQNAAARREEAYWQVVDKTAPDCLELYAMMESCAELAGRVPEFGFGQFPMREGPLAALLRAELKALSQCNKAELYLRQLAQVQEELVHYFELNREKDRTIAKLHQRLDSAPLTALRKTAHKTLGLGKSAARLIASTPPRAWITQTGKMLTMIKQAEMIRSSGLFDEKWYRETYPDVTKAGLDPVQHYLQFGVREGRNPSSQFSTRWYLDTYLDVAGTEMNPLVHYIEFGRREGRRPLKTPSAVRTGG